MESQISGIEVLVKMAHAAHEDKLEVQKQELLKKHQARHKAIHFALEAVVGQTFYDAAFRSGVYEDLPDGDSWYYLGDYIFAVRNNMCGDEPEIYVHSVVPRPKGTMWGVWSRASNLDELLVAIVDEDARRAKWYEQQAKEEAPQEAERYLSAKEAAIVAFLSDIIHDIKHGYQATIKTEAVMAYANLVLNIDTDSYDYEPDSDDDDM